jgi:hypothetical protein
MDDCILVKDIRVRRFGDDVMIEGYIQDELTKGGSAIKNGIEN